MQAYVSSSYYPVLPPPRKTSLYQLQEKICLNQTFCALIQLKSQTQCSGLANIPSKTIPSEDTQNILYFPCILLRLRPMLSHVLEEGVCERSILLVPLWLKAAAHTQFTQKRPGNTFFLEINVASCTTDTCRKMWPPSGLHVIHK